MILNIIVLKLDCANGIFYVYFTYISLEHSLQWDLLDRTVPAIKAEFSRQGLTDEQAKFVIDALETGIAQYWHVGILRVLGLFDDGKLIARHAKQDFHHVRECIDLIIQTKGETPVD
ncbi:MAG: hypothetical protein V7739_21140 [Motiliproteus sp.]